MATDSTLLASVEQLERQTEEGLPVATAEQLLEQASGVVRNHCRWRIDYAENDELLVDAPRHGDALLLPSLRLLQVQSLTIGGVALTGFTHTLSGVLERRGGWPRGIVRAVVTHGWNPVPAEIRAVTIGVALRMWLNPEAAASYSLAGSTQTVGSAGGGAGRSLGLLDTEIDMLDAYAVKVT